MKWTRKQIQDLFVRCCRDSNWTGDAIKMAIFTANILKIDPLEVWLAMPSLSVMEDIANHNHPVCDNLSH